jgi:hypothetical protein
LILMPMMAMDFTILQCRNFLHSRQILRCRWRGKKRKDEKRKLARG